MNLYMHLWFRSFFKDSTITHEHEMYTHTPPKTRPSAQGSPRTAQQWDVTC